MSGGGTGLLGDEPLHGGVCGSAAALLSSGPPLNAGTCRRPGSEQQREATCHPSDGQPVCHPVPSRAWEVSTLCQQRECQLVQPRGAMIKM